ncbi:MAG: lamin tail domain-containing protein [Candidatus Beckwithbacteria bacterium]
MTARRKINYLQGLTLKVLISAVIGAIFLSTSYSPLFAQVKINEFSSESSSDWVELYNNSDDEVDLTTYTLTDGSASGNTKSFTCILAPRGFYVVDWSSKLNNDGDIIKLQNDNRVIDCVTYGNGADKLCEGQTEVNLSKMNEGEFGARTEDGIGIWQIKNTNTKDGPNDGSQKNPEAGCFVSSPSPEPSLSPETSSKNGVYKINEAKDENGEGLSSVLVYVDNVYIHHYTPEILTFCDGCRCSDYVDCGFGVHTIRLEKNNFSNWTETKTINSEDYYEVNPTMQPIDSSSSSSPTPSPSLGSSPQPAGINPADTEGETESGWLTGSDPVSFESSKSGEIKGASESGEKDEKKDKSYLISIVLTGMGLGLIISTGIVFYKQGLYNQ